MTRGRAAVLSLALGLATAIGWQPPAAAQDDDVARARELFDEARVAFDARHYPEARALLEESLDLAPRTPTAHNLARVLRSMGELLEAERVLEMTLNGEHGEIDPARREEIETLLRAIRDEIPVLSVAIEDRDEATIAVDGLDAGTATSNAPLAVRVNPTEHVVSGTARDRTTARASVSPRTGERRSIALAFGPAPAAGAVERDEGGGVLASPWFWVVAGLLVAGGATATVVLLTQDRTADPIGDPVFPIAEALRF